MSDACAISYEEAIKQIRNKLKVMLGGQNNPIVDHVLEDMSKKLQKDLELYAHFRESGDPDTIAYVQRKVQQHIDDAITTVTALNVASDVFRTKLIGSTGLDDMKIAVQAELQSISNHLDRSTSMLDSLITQQVSAIIEHAPSATAKQIKHTRRLFYNLLTEGDVAVEKYLKQRGIDDPLAFIIRGRKQGHIKDKALVNKMPELNMVFKTIHSIEKIVQEKLMIEKPGYLFREGYAFSLDFDSNIMRTMSLDGTTRRNFIDALYDTDGKFIFKLEKYGKRHKDLNPKDLEHAFARKLFKDITDSRYDDTLVSKNKSNLSTFHARELEFASEAGEITFYKKFKNKQEGVLREGFSHFERQLKQLAVRNKLGSDRQVWLSNAKATIIQHFRALGKDEHFFDDFETTWIGVERDFNAVAGAANPMTQSQDDLYKASQFLIRTLLTPWSAGRNVGYDNTFHVANISRTFGTLPPGSKFTILQSGVARIGVLLLAMSKNVVNLKSQQRISALMERSFISSELTAFSAWQRVFAPGDSSFSKLDAKGMASLVKRIAQKTASGVSKVTLADATFKAARQLQFLEAADHYHMLANNFEGRSVY